MFKSLKTQMYGKSLESEIQKFIQNEIQLNLFFYL